MDTLLLNVDKLVEKLKGIYYKGLIDGILIGVLFMLVLYILLKEGPWKKTN